MSPNTDIVLVKPGSQKQLYGELSAFELTAIEPPLWGALLAGYLRRLGYRVVLIDAEVENLSYEQTAERIRETNPVLAAVVVSGTNPSASTMNMDGTQTICALVREKNPRIRTLLAGLHPSALPERTIMDGKSDFVCQGEGFYTLPKLIDVLKAGGTNFAIDGLWNRKDGKPVSNLRPKLMKNLDDLPMPAWDMLPMERYRAHTWHCFGDIQNRQPYGVIYTSLGCPFRCSFCCIHSFFGKHAIRYRSPETVIREIDFLVEHYGIRNIKIIDEMFALNESHVTRLCDLIVEHGHDLNMWAYARVNTVNERMLEKMKKAGINWVAYGFESGSEAVLKGVTKGYALDAVAETVRITYAQGLYICANFIFGLPDDDLDSMQKTLDLAKQINAEWANLYSVMAFPGSELYKQAVEKGWPLPETWQGYSQYNYESLPLPTRHLNGPQVLRFRDKAFMEYYKNPDYLEKIGQVFGADTVNHIKMMTSHELTRKYVEK